MWKFLRVSDISEYKIKCVTKHTVLGKMMDMREVRDTHRWEVRRWGYRWG